MIDGLLLRRPRPRRADSWRPQTATMQLPAEAVPALFGSAEQAEFSHGQIRTFNSLAESLGTRAGMLVMPEDQRREALHRVRAFLAAEPETAAGEFVLPMLTGVLRTKRR